MTDIFRLPDGTSQALRDTYLYYKTVWYYWVSDSKFRHAPANVPLQVKGGTYSNCDILADRPSARLHLYGLLSITFDLWSKEHYRNPTFKSDLQKNLRNVAIPGTGVPLSVICCCQFVARLFCLFVYPVLAIGVALRHQKKDTSSLAVYSETLLAPDNWFALWQLNCRITSKHASVTNDPSYSMENKWDFLKAGMDKGVPVSPFMQVDSLVIKDKNEEGGMGIHMFKNAVSGGDFIIQKKFQNSEFIASLLPKSAPLSTLRIVTASHLSHRDKSSSATDPDVFAMCCVFRAGRANAKTDHSSILFDVDMNTGKILLGTTNQHWYQLGITGITHPAEPEIFEVHPDTQKRVMGLVIPDMKDLVKVVCDAHEKLMPNVPLAGWDVALTTEGVMLLEANLSCNFFQASFNHAKYINFADSVFRHLDAQHV